MGAARPVVGRRARIQFRLQVEAEVLATALPVQPVAFEVNKVFLSRVAPALNVEPEQLACNRLNLRAESD
jgi:hypothetical protein